MRGLTRKKSTWIAKADIRSGWNTTAKNPNTAKNELKSISSLEKLDQLALYAKVFTNSKEKLDIWINDAVNNLISEERWNIEKSSFANPIDLHQLIG